MPYSTRFCDHFYSRADGRAECDHVFLAGNDLPRRWAGSTRFTIAELGFGTGLNFVETWRTWKATRPPSGRLHFISFELDPMAGRDIGRALSAWPDIRDEAARLVSAWPAAIATDFSFQFDSQTRLSLVKGDAAVSLSGFGGCANAWYLDGFAPARNPQMWSEKLMEEVFSHTVPGGTFATYTAAGRVRRALVAAGFEVQKRAGYAGKREMLAGVRPV